MSLVRLDLRRHRLLIALWTVLLTAVSAGTLSAYQSTYATAEQRATATELAQHNAATTLMYGRLSSPGSPAQMFSWEAGAIVTILAAVMAVLLAVGLTRSAEDDGTLELVRSTGADPRSPLRSAATVLVLVATALAGGCSAAVGVQGGNVDAVTWSGAVAYGAVVGVTFLLVAALTVVLAQVVAAAGHARLLGFSAVAAAFAVRAVGDTQDMSALSWFSPLGLRETVRPFQGDRWWVLLVYAAVAAALFRLAALLSERREYGAGLLPRRDRHEAHLEVHSGLALTAHLARGSVLAWGVAIACIGGMFGAMGSGVVQQSQDEELGGFLGSQLGPDDPIAGYFAYTGTVVGLLVCSFAVLAVLRAKQDETAGLTDHLLAAGTRRWAPLAWQLSVAAMACFAILLCTGALSALAAAQFIGGEDVAVRAFSYVAGQWPAAIAAAGWTVLLVGLRPRLAWLAWLPLAASGAVALLGPLLGLPHWALDAGVFGHVPDVAAVGLDVDGLLMLLAVAAVSCSLGLLAVTHRDV